MQTNNIWFFPHQLMHPSLAPPTAAKTVTTGFSGATGYPFQVPLNPTHFSKEEVKRAHQTYTLHHFLCHPSDRVLKSTLDQGLLSNHTNLTSSDVDLMTRFYGQCLSCAQANFQHHDLHVTSTSFPSTNIGQRVFFDLQRLTEPSLGGNWEALTFVDDYTGFTTVLGSKSKSQDDIVDCICRLISIYNAQGHHISSFCSDSEAICKSLATPLGLLHAHITHTPPDDHCHKVERYIQQIDKKVIAIREALPYILPPKYTIYAKSYVAHCMNITPQSTLPLSTNPYRLFYKKNPELNPNRDLALAPFGTVCMIMHTDHQRELLASKAGINFHHAPKSSIAVNLGFSPNHPGCNLFLCPPSTTPLVRDNFQVITLIPWEWTPKPVVQQTYVSNINPAVETILLNDDYPQRSKAIDQTLSKHQSNLPHSETQVLSPPAPEFPVSEPRPDKPAADFPIPNSATPATGHSNLRTSAQHFPNSEPSQFEHRFPTRSHRVPSRFACSASTTPHTTPSSLFASKSEQAEFSIKKGLLMDNYKHAVGPAITKELTKMFVTYKVLHFINKTDVPPDAVFFRFFCFLKLKFLPDNSFERMSARLCAMEATPPPANAETAYAATGDHHLFLLTVNAVLAAAIHGGYLDRFEMWRYDVPAAFL